MESIAELKLKINLLRTEIKEIEKLSSINFEEIVSYVYNKNIPPIFIEWRRKQRYLEIYTNKLAYLERNIHATRKNRKER